MTKRGCVFGTSPFYIYINKAHVNITTDCFRQVVKLEMSSTSVLVQPCFRIKTFNGNLAESKCPTCG